MQKRSAACARGRRGGISWSQLLAWIHHLHCKAALLRSPGGRSIPSMVYLCIHIGGEWEWSLPSILSSLNIFRKPSISSAPSILGSINGEMWRGVLTLVRIYTINTCQTAPWLLSRMIFHHIKCPESKVKCIERHSEIVLICLFLHVKSPEKHTCTGVICQVKPSHLSSGGGRLVLQVVLPQPTLTHQ